MSEQLSEFRLWPIQGAANVAGLSVELLLSGIEAGDIPVALVTLGPARRRFVRGAQMVAWLDGRAPSTFPSPAVDSCVDLLT